MAGHAVGMNGHATLVSLRHTYRGLFGPSPFFIKVMGFRNIKNNYSMISLGCGPKSEVVPQGASWISIARQSDASLSLTTFLNLGVR
jgi:hypothetical protein